MGFLDALRDALGIAPRPATTPPQPHQATIKVERVTRPATPAGSFERLYLPPREQAETLTPRSDGFPPLRFIRRGSDLWLAENTTGKLVNVDSRYLQRLGIWACRIRGVNYYPAPVRHGPAVLVREPDNEHDPNAVAVQVGDAIVGHYNKAKARGLAELLDAGEPLVARIISEDPPKVLAARADIIAYLDRDL